jgi:hypothetical protein
MVRFLSTILIIFLAGPLRGQKDKPRNLPNFLLDRYHIGIGTGFQTTNFIVKARDGFKIKEQGNPGVCVHLVGSMGLCEFLEIKVRPGLSFGQRDLWIQKQSMDSSEQWNVRLESVYLDVPILLKYKAKRLNNFAPYLMVGLSPRFDIYGGMIQVSKPKTRILRVFDFYFEPGTGIDFYLQYAKLAVELSYPIGFLNVYLPTIKDYTNSPFGDSIEKLRSRMMVLTFQFEGR